MWIGLFFILMGFLILVQPQILVAMIAGAFIAAGVTMMMISWRLRKVYRDLDNAAKPWQQFFIRF